MRHGHTTTPFVRPLARSLYLVGRGGERISMRGLLTTLHLIAFTVPLAYCKNQAPLYRPRTRRAPHSQRSNVSLPALLVVQRAGSTDHTPRLPARTLPSAAAPPTPHTRATHPHMAGRSLPPPRAHATYLACVVRHTSTSSVGWIAAHVVHVAAAEIGRAEVNIRLCPVCVVCAAVGCGLEVGVCSGTSFLRAAGCSIRRQCSHRFTVRGGRTDAGGGRLGSERQPRSIIASLLFVTRCW